MNRKKSVIVFVLAVIFIISLSVMPVTAFGETLPVLTENNIMSVSEESADDSNEEADAIAAVNQSGQVMNLMTDPCTQHSFNENFVCTKCSEKAFDVGVGSVDNPYRISEKRHLENLARIVNDNNDCSGKYFVLTCDIGSAESPVTTTVGRYSYSDAQFGFKGVFDGNCHKVTLGIDGTGRTNAGLFGWVCSEGIIKNVSVAGSMSEGTQTAGGICATNDGKIINCCNSGSIYYNGTYAGGVCGYNSGTVVNCYNTGGVSGSSTFAGGVCGYNKGTVANCYNTGSVSDTGDYAGGVCGYNAVTATIVNCYNTGSVSGTSTYAGGVCGNNADTAKIVNCYNTGSVSGTSTYAGGVCGANNGAINNCYYDNQTCGICNAIGTGLPSTQMKGKSGTKDDTWVAVGGEKKPLVDLLNTGYNGSEVLLYPAVWKVSENSYPDIHVHLPCNDIMHNGTHHWNACAASDCPLNMGTDDEIISNYETAFADTQSGATYKTFFNFNAHIFGDDFVCSQCSANAFAGGSGTLSAPYLIADKPQLENLANIVNSGNDCAGKFFVLKADIGSFSAPVVTVIGNDSNCFSGHFDGAGHSVMLKVISQSGPAGLFGSLGANGEITNVSVAGSVQSDNVAGGLCGKNNSGTISNCCSSCIVQAVSLAGGLSGSNESGTIINCFVTGSVICNTSGAFCGNNNGTVRCCYYDKNVYTGNKYAGQGSGQAVECFALPTVQMQGESGTSKENWEPVSGVRKSLVDLLNGYKNADGLYPENWCIWGVSDKTNSYPEFAIPVAEVGNYRYATLREALTAAGSVATADFNKTVLLLCDLTGENGVSSVEIPPNVIFDLNGKKLEAGSVVAFGVVRDSSESKGKLIVGKKNFIYSAGTEKLPGNECVLPVWDTSGGLSGYIFCPVSNIKTVWDPGLDAGENPKYKFRPESYAIDNIFAYTDGSADSGVKVYAEIEYTRDGVNFDAMSVKFARRYIDSFISNYSLNYGLFVSLSGTNGITGLKARTIIRSENTGFCIVSERISVTR